MSTALCIVSLEEPRHEPALLHESSLARMMPTDRILTGQFATRYFVLYLG